MTTHLSVAVICARRPRDVYFFVQPLEASWFQRYWQLPSFSAIGEIDHDALREYMEARYGIRLATQLTPFIRYTASCGDHSVHYYAYVVSEYTGNWSPPDDEMGYWENTKELRIHQKGIPYPILPTQHAIIRTLQWPTLLPITSTALYGYEPMLSMARQAIYQGCPCLYVREKTMADDAWVHFVSTLLKDAHKNDCLLVVNDRLERLRRIKGIQAIHLDAHTLLNTNKRPHYRWVTASCHTLEEYIHASTLGLNAALIGHIKETPEHTGPGIGIEGLRHFTGEGRLPIFGIGGLGEPDIAEVQKHGAYGVASIRHFWSSYVSSFAGKT